MKELKTGSNLFQKSIKLELFLRIGRAFLFKISIMSWRNFFTKQKKEDLDQGLEKTKQSFFNKIAHSVAGKSRVDEEVLDDLEEVLVSSDVSVKTTLKIIDRLEERVKQDKYVGVNELNGLLKKEISDMLYESNVEDIADYVVPKSDTPHVIMVVGVNGVGKTTTIGKLAHQFKNKGYNVVLGAADTFRAAAVEQLEIWSKRTNSTFFSSNIENSDPASLSYSSYLKAQEQKIDILIIDTAGRLHNKSNLMDQLTKIIRVLKKINASAPDEVILVLDGNTGQNSIKQASVFKEICDINSLRISKLDGTAKGGAVIPIGKILKIPIIGLGVGEQKEDLVKFEADEFARALLDIN